MPSLFFEGRELPNHVRRRLSDTVVVCQCCSSHHSCDSKHALQTPHIVTIWIKVARPFGGILPGGVSSGGPGPAGTSGMYPGMPGLGAFPGYPGHWGMVYPGHTWIPPESAAMAYPHATGAPEDASVAVAPEGSGGGGDEESGSAPRTMTPPRSTTTGSRRGSGLSGPAVSASEGTSAAAPRRSG